jgi:deoxyribodipyrimidine photo-lyase
MSKKEIAIFWFRRDLRLHDNCGLFHALKSGYPVIPIFIFDKDILNELPKNDARVSFIYETLNALNNQLIKIGSAVKIEIGSVEQVFEKLLKNFKIKEVYSNKDYEPYAIKRDLKIQQLCSEKDIAFKSFKDQVIF